MAKDPISVLMTADAIGGIWTYALDLGGQLVSDGHRVTMAVLGPGLDDAKRSAAAARDVAIVETPANPEWLAADAAEVARAGDMLASVARESGSDLIHLNHPALAAQTVMPLPVLGGCHSCLATWWAAVKGTPLPDDFRWRTALVRDGYKACHLLVAPSRAFAEATQRTYELQTLPEVVHNGRSADVAAEPAAKPAEAVFTAGRLWDEGKNAKTLDRVAALTLAPFRAAGPTTGPNGATIATEHLDILGPLSEPEMRLRLAEQPVYVSAALFEPFGLAVLEAAQAGCSLVLSDIESFRELWTDAALFVPAMDEEAIAASIGRMLSDPELRADMAHAARNRARAFSLKASADDMAGLYRTILNRPQQQTGNAA